MTARGSSPLRMMLILSAIDLLSSALTAGLVLFVILVGGDTGTTQASTDPGGSALNIVTIVYHSGHPALYKQRKDHHFSQPPTGLQLQYFGGGTSSLHHRRYFVPVGTKRLLVTAASSPFEIVFQPVTGDSFSIFVNCSTDGGRFQLELSPLTLTPCPPGPPAGAPRLEKVTLLLPKEAGLAGLPKTAEHAPGHSRYSLDSPFTVPATVSIWGVLR